MAIRMLVSTASTANGQIRATSATASAAGYQECGLSGKTGGTATGLANTTQYYLKVNHNGKGVIETSITTASTTTFTAVIALLNAAMTGHLTGAVWSITGGDLRLTSSIVGTGGTIAMTSGTTGTDFFGALTGWTANEAAVAGTGPAEDPNGYSIIPGSGFSMVYPLNGCNEVTVQGVADATVTGNVLVEGSMTAAGPWATVGTLTAGLGFVNFPAGSHYEFTRINGNSITGGPFHANMDAYFPNGNRMW